MPRLRVSAEAAADVQAIADYIKRDRPSAAHRLGARLYRTFEFLSHHPSAGTSRDDISPGLRMFVPGRPASRYLTFFRHDSAGDVVEIVAVMDAARDWETILSEGGD
jgi:toxin ParE1/3/4